MVNEQITKKYLKTFFYFKWLQIGYVITIQSST